MFVVVVVVIAVCDQYFLIMFFYRVEWRAPHFFGINIKFYAYGHIQYQIFANRHDLSSPIDASPEMGIQVVIPESRYKIYVQRNKSSS